MVGRSLFSDSGPVFSHYLAVCMAVSLWALHSGQVLVRWVLPIREIGGGPCGFLRILQSGLGTLRILQLDE